jgi:hypothetical protein
MMRRGEEPVVPSMPNPVSAGAPRSYRRMYGAGQPPHSGHQHPQHQHSPYQHGQQQQHGHGHPHGGMERGNVPSYRRTESTDGGRRAHHSSHEEEGVEVVLESSVAKVVDSPVRGRRHDQNVFRPPPHPNHHRPRAMRAPHGHPSMQNSASGSYGYGPPPPPPPRRSDYPHQRPPPTQVPYAQSGSFDQEYPGPSGPPSGPGAPPAQHYSPQIHYPTPGRGYQSEDVNVISPNHKPDTYNSRPPSTPRPRHAPSSQYYQYPPTSPVSRPNGHASSPPRKPYGGMRRPDRSPAAEGPYSAAQRDAHAYHPDDGTFNSFSAPAAGGEQRPPLVAESSFDSDNYASSSHYSSHPPTPAAAHHPQEPQSQFYGGGSWGSFESAPPPPHFDDYRYYGHGYQHPDSPYSQHYSPGQQPQGYYGEPYPPHHAYDRPPYEEDEHGVMREYHPDGEGIHSVTPNDKKHGDSIDGDDHHHGGKTANGIILPKAASEVDFVVTAPPMEPILPPSDHPVCDSPASINSHDVLCGRGGGTNSQVGNRRFRKLVQDFQPTYLLARRKEKPLLARTIVLIIRNRGGRFLKKDEETGELYEVGDQKAEAKTSQALREGLDVRATKSAATSATDKKKKKKETKDKDETEDNKEQTEETQEDMKEEQIVTPMPNRDKTPPRQKDDDMVAKTPPPSPPPPLPRLAQGEIKAGIVHPHSPEALQFRKRRRMRSAGCLPMQDKLFPDFCPPRADLHRAASPFAGGEDDMEMATTPPHRNAGRAVEGQEYPDPQPGCAGIAMSIMTGAATGSFCLGPSNWRRK